MNKKFLISSVLSSVVLYVVLYNNFLYTYVESIVAPLFLVSLFSLATSVYLLFFNSKIQQAWWRWARFVLLVPFGIILWLLPTYSGGGGFVSFGGTTDAVIVWGVVFVLASIIFTLYQRFWLKTGV